MGCAKPQSGEKTIEEEPEKRQKEQLGDGSCQGPKIDAKNKAVSPSCSSGNQKNKTQ